MPAGALAAGLPRQDHLYTITHESFRFHNKNFDEMRCKLDSTENLRSFEKYLTPHWSISFPSSTFGCGRWIQIFWVANTWIDLKREIMYTLHFPNFCGGRDDFPTLNRNASAANLIQIRPATSIERNPPPRGGFLFTIFPHQEPCVRGPPSKDFFNVLRGWGGSFDQFLRRRAHKCDKMIFMFIISIRPHWFTECNPGSQADEHFHGLVVPFGTSGMVQVDRPFVLVPLVPRRSEDPLLLVPLVPLRSEDPLLLVPLVPRLQLVLTCPIWLYHLSFANSLFSDFFLGSSVSFHFSKNTFEWKIFFQVLSCWRRYQWQPNFR